MSTLVVGVGNEYRGDDGFGIAVADALGTSLAPYAEVTMVRGDGLSLLDLWDGYHRVIIVDAVAVDRPPGTVLAFDVSETGLPTELSGTSTHALGPAGAVEMARNLGTLPPRVEILAAAGACFETGAPMSAPLRAVVAAVAERIAAMVTEPTTEDSTDA